jgi:TRAP-type uncharacterized transport system fused permease subunit
MKLAWPAYIVPFLFIFTPALIFDGTWREIGWTLATAILGIYMVTAGIVGFFKRSVTSVERVMLVAAGMLALLPASILPGFFWTDVLGVIGFSALWIVIRPRATEASADVHQEQQAR